MELSVVRDGAWIENKGASLTFHFRATPEEKRVEIENTARQIIEKAGFKVGNAHMALEARPKVEWNKGSVALLILDRHFGANKWKGDVNVIFAGDDTTDEDAMLVRSNIKAKKSIKKHNMLQALKGNAATFRIAPNVDIKTHAEKLLSSTQSVVDVLKLVKKLTKK